MKWELVTDDTFRLKVPGGWLYRYDTYTPFEPSGRRLMTSTIVFVAGSA